ncbi:MAG: hypothetical protein HMLIMOIP_002564 [Candidatus Nitrosomirales archaeon]|jgi:hypothetical protein
MPLDSNEQFPEMPEGVIPDVEESDVVVQEEGFPTPWHMINALLEVECRQLDFDTYELRSPSHTLTLNKEGFNLYRDDSTQGQVIFEDWLDRNNIVSVPRDDI